MPRNRPETPREEKVVELLDAAESLFRERGFLGTSTARIARRAGVSEKTLFWYFPSKDHLLVAVVEREVRRLQHRLRRQGWPSGDLGADLAAFVRALRPIRHLLPVVHQRAEVADVVARFREEIRAVNLRRIGAILRRAGASEADAVAVTHIAVSFVDGVLLRNLGDDEIDSLCRVLVDRLIP